MIQNDDNGEDYRQDDMDSPDYDTNDHPKEKRPKHPEKDLCPEDHPCEDYPGEEDPPTSGCDCSGHCHCDWEVKLPRPVRRILELLREELKVPPECAGASTVAKDEFKAALDACEVEYDGLGDLIKEYRDYHCGIDCDLQDAEDQCKKIEAWCKLVDRKTRECIERTWYECYEKVEFQLECCCLLERKKQYESLKDCFEQAKTLEEEAQADFDAAKAFKETLEGYFATLKELFEKAEAEDAANNHEAVCAISLEYRKIYHSLHELVLWEDRRRRCKKGLKPTKRGCRRPSKVKDRRSWRWYRRELLETLRSLLEAKYRRYCFHQRQIDKQHCMEVCSEELEAFRNTRQEKFILEAQECGGDDDYELGQ